MSQSLQEKYNLPGSVKILIKRSKKGSFYAKLPDYPGCMTLANSELELIANITDAILTYFEVPREEAKKCNIVYLPQSLSAPQATFKPELNESEKAFFLLFGAPNCYGKYSYVR